MSLVGASVIKNLTGRVPLRAAHRAVAGSVLTGLLTQGTLIISGSLTARFLGVEDRGQFALLTLVPFILVPLGGLGLPLAVTYYIARDPTCTFVLIRSLIVPALLQTVALILAHVLILFIMLRDDGSAMRTAALYTIAATPAALMWHYGIAILQGEHRFASFNIMRMLPIVANGAGLVLLMVFQATSLPLIALAWSASNMVGGAVALVVALAKRRDDDPEARVPSRAQLLRFGMTGVIGSVTPAETFRLDQVAVGLFLSPAALGLYVVGQAFSNLPRFVAQSIGMVVYPRIARQSRSPEQQSIWSLFWFTAALCGILVGIIAAAARWLVPLFFGQEFAAAVGLTQILLAAAFFASITRVLGDAMRGAGYPAFGTAAEIASWIALPFAMLALLPRWGAEGVAASLLISSVISLIALLSLWVVARQNRAAGRLWATPSIIGHGPP